MNETNQHFNQHIHACISVFVCLLVLTGITVSASYLNVPTAATVAIALSIAVVKGSLVMSYFMHLISEKKLIYFTLGLTAVFFLGLLFLPLAAKFDPIRMLIAREY
jgi:cytochrome c oxidase subunit 4